MLPLKFLFAIFTITASGYCVLVMALKGLKKFAVLELIALSFGTGCGCITLIMVFMPLFKCKFTISNILLFQLPLYIFGVYNFLKQRKNIPREESPVGKFDISKYSIIDYLFIILITFNIICVVFSALSMPLSVWDSWAAWGYRAKAFFLKGTIDSRIFTKFSEGGLSNPHYPLLFPFLEVYAWIFQGIIHEPSANLIGGLFYICSLIIFYFVLKRGFQRTPALGVTFVLSSLPVLVRLAPIGYADVPKAFYSTAVVLYVWLYLKDSDFSYLLLGCIFLGIGMWTKSEGTSHWISVLFAVIFLNSIKKITIPKIHIWFLFIIPLVIFLPWIIFKISKGYTGLMHQNPDIEPYNLWGPGRLPLVANFFLKEIVDIGQWNLLWILFIMVMAISFKKENMFLLCFILVQIASYVMVYFFLPQSLPTLQWGMPNCVSRILLHVAPIVLFFITRQLYERCSINSL